MGRPAFSSECSLVSPHALVTSTARPPGGSAVFSGGPQGALPLGPGKFILTPEAADPPQPCIT